MTTLQKHKLEPKRLRMVHSNLQKEARLVLIEAVQGAKEGLTIEAPLILYDDKGLYSEEALSFCPFLK